MTTFPTPTVRTGSTRIADQLRARGITSAQARGFDLTDWTYFAQQAHTRRYDPAEVIAYLAGGERDTALHADPFDGLVA